MVAFASVRLRPERSESKYGYDTMMMTTVKFEVMVAMAIKRKRGQIEGAKRRVGITVGLSVVHHAACLDYLTSQGDLETDRQRPGVSARRGGGRCGREAGKVGGGVRDVVHRSLSTVC